MSINKNFNFVCNVAPFPVVVDCALLAYSKELSK